MQREPQQRSVCCPSAPQEQGACWWVRCTRGYRGWNCIGSRWVWGLTSGRCCQSPPTRRVVLMKLCSLVWQRESWWLEWWGIGRSEEWVQRGAGLEPSWTQQHLKWPNLFEVASVLNLSWFNIKQKMMSRFAKGTVTLKS